MKNLLTLAAALVAAAVTAAEPKFGKEALSIDMGGGKTASLYFPEVNSAKPTKTSVSGSTAEFSYASGAKLVLEEFADHVRYSLPSAPGVKNVKFHLVLPTSLAGANWKIGSKGGTFPSAKGGVKLFQGNAGDMAIEGAGVKFAVRLPVDFCWSELQDLRTWNWNAFGLMFTTPYNADHRVVVIPFGPDASKFASVKSKAEQAFFAKHGKSGGRSSGGTGKAEIPTMRVSMGGDGVGISCGSMGSFKLAHPRLAIGGEARSKPIETKLEGNVCTLKFKGGGVLKATLRDRTVSYELAAVPQGYKSPFQEMFVPFNFNQGGKWTVDGTTGAYPLVKGGAKLYQGNGSRVAVTDPNNATLALKFSVAPYVEVQDNREWGWSIFYNGFHLPGGLRNWSVNLSLDTSAFARKRLLDKFGQVPREFAGKIKSEAELEADVKTEAAYYKSLAFRQKLAEKGYKLDSFGGLAGEGAKMGLRKTGFFHCEKKTVKGRERWYLVDPEGNPFFHLGICGFGASDDYTNVEGRQDAFEWLPPHEGPMARAWKDAPGSWWNSRAVSFYKANVIRKYGSYDDATMSERFVDRVREIGFNSVGAFSGRPAAVESRNFPYVTFVPLGSPKMIPSIRGMFDPFDEKSVAEVTKAMKGCAARANDPLLIGLFLANEQGLEDIPRAVPALNATYAAKREFVKFLGKKYGTIAAFNAAWNAKEPDFKALEDKGLAVVTKPAFADVRAFTEIFLEAYYSLIERNFRANDPNHMLIGNRWQPGTANDEILCRVCGKYMDVVSINYYTGGVDRKFINRIYEWSGRKPQFWSEFYYTSTKESNCSPASHDLETQAKRGMAYRNYLEDGADLGFLVGIEWFTLIDQAATGRFFEGQNGERNNTGLFNVADRPYRDMWQQMLQAHLDVYPVWFGLAEPWKFDDPRYNGKGDATRRCSIGHPIAPMAVDGKQDGYPLRPPERISSSRIVMGRDAEGLEATFKGAWDKDNLYLLVTIKDRTPMCNRHSGDRLWNGDGIELFLGAEEIEKGGPMLFTDRQIMISGAKSDDFFVPRVAKQPAIRSKVVPTADGEGYVLECAIPWSAIDWTPVENATILFDIAIDDAPANADRKVQLMWNGSQRNSSDRSHWGRLTLVP